MADNVFVVKNVMRRQCSNMEDTYFGDTVCKDNIHAESDGTAKTQTNTDDSVSMISFHE